MDSQEAVPFEPKKRNRSAGFRPLLDNAVNKLRRKTDVSVGIEHVVNLVLSEGRSHFRCMHQHILEGNFLLIGLHAGLVDD